MRGQTKTVHVTNPMYKGTAFEITAQQSRDNSEGGKGGNDTVYRIKLLNFIVGVLTLLFSYSSLVASCNSFKNDCSGYVYTDCVQNDDGSGSPLCTYTWNTTNCTLFDGKNPDSYYDSYETFAFWLQDQGDNNCANATLPLAASCAEYCESLTCSPGFVMGAYAVFIFPFAAPVPGGGGNGFCDKVLDVCMATITSITVKVARLAASAYMAYPVDGGQSEFLAAEMLVSTGIFAVLFFVCCPKCCGDGSNGSTADWKVYRKRFIGSRFAAGFWACMIAILVIASAGVSPMSYLPFSGSFLFNPKQVGYGVLVSIGTIFVQGGLEIVDFFGVVSGLLKG